MNTFQSDLVRGKVGENLVRNYLEKGGATVFDVSDDIRYRNEDIDFLAIMPAGNRVKIEVKTDYKAQQTGNLPIEYDTGGTPGWFMKTESEAVFFVIVDETKRVNQVSAVYAAKMSEIRQFISDNITLIKTVGMGDSRESGKQGKGYLIPINAMFNGKKLFKKIDMGKV